MEGHEEDLENISHTLKSFVKQGYKRFKIVNKLFILITAKLIFLLKKNVGSILST